MKHHILASGSKGNCTYIESEKAKILVDVGLSLKRTEQLLKKIGVLPGELDAIFITHEHVDHIQGLRISSKYNIPVYATSGTWSRIEQNIIDGSDNIRFIASNKDLELNDLCINAFPIPHDAAEPVGYGIDDGKDKIGIATDFGKFTKEMQVGLFGSTIYIFEANHDEDMVAASSYPDSLKSRILSDYGHISNENAANALAELLQGGEQVYLAHLSETNNLPSLALMTVKNILRNRGFHSSELKIQLAGKEV